MEYILSVFDNDEDRDLKYLKWETQKIKEDLFDKHLLGQLIHISHSNIGLNVLVRTIQKLRSQLTWFHFSGHHNQGKIQLEDSKFENLVENLKLCENLKVVFINGCNSRKLIEDLSEFVPICIGTNESIYDCIAAEFSHNFYQAIFNSNSKVWRDYKAIHESFNVVLGNLNSAWDGNIENAFNEKLQICGKERGIGVNEGLQNMYCISERLDEKETVFIGKNTLLNPDKESLFEIIRKDCNYEFPNHYHECVPVFFQEYVKSIIQSSKIQKFGQDRFKVISAYYMTYLNLVRCSVLSLIFDAIFKLRSDAPSDNTKFIDAFNLFFSITPGSNEEYFKLVFKNLFSRLDEYSMQEIENLFNLIDSISKNISDEFKPFLDALLKSRKFFKNYLDLFKGTGEEDEHFRSAELALMELLKYSSHLNSYYVKSIHSRFYIKKRTDKDYCYLVRSGIKTGKPKEDIETNELTSGFENNYSVYICGEKNKFSLNLSPFYIDCNSVKASPKGVDIFSFSEIEIEKNYFKYMSMDGMHTLTIDSETYDCSNELIKTNRLKVEATSYEQLKWLIDTLRIWNNNLFTNIVHR